MPQPKPNLQPVWLSIETAIMAWEPQHPTPHQNAFDLARMAHGLMGQHGINPRSIRPHTAARRIDAMLRDHGKAQHGITEALAACWNRVGVPEGYEPFQWAVMRFRWLKRPRKAPGSYVTKQQARLATLLWHAFSWLPPDHEGAVYLSCRHIANHTGTNKDYAALTLKEMVRAGILTPHRNHTQATATRYLLRHCPIDR